MTKTGDVAEMPEEWEDYTIRMKKDPARPYHGSEIEFNGCRYIRADAAASGGEVAADPNSDDPDGRSEANYMFHEAYDHIVDNSECFRASPLFRETMGRIYEAFVTVQSALNKAAQHSPDAVTVEELTEYMIKTIIYSHSTKESCVRDLMRKYPNGLRIVSPDVGGGG